MAAVTSSKPISLQEVSSAEAATGDFIRIRGARTHNLKNVNLDLPRNRLVVITGLSGSGKSSLAFDTLYGKASAVTWSHCRHTRASFSSSWKSRTST